MQLGWAKRKFHSNVNVILGRIGTSAAPDVVLKLINAQGLQNLLYGISATTLTQCELKSFCHAYNSVFSKLFNSFDKDIITSCQYYCGYLSFDKLYEMYRYSFLLKLLNKKDIDETLEKDKSDIKD